MMNSVKINYVAVAATLVVVFVIATHFHFKRSTLQGTVNLKELLSVSLDLAEAGGRKVVEIKKVHNLNAESKGKTKEGKEELKTDGDMQSHRTIMAGFHQAFPLLQTRIVSEEHDTRSRQEEPVTSSKIRSDVQHLPDEIVNARDVTIWIDPLDATQEYTEDLDEYVTVMVCVAVKGEPVLGVIRRPQKSKDYEPETVWAWVGKGMSNNLQPVKKTDESSPVDKPEVIISRSHSGDAKDVVDRAFGKGNGKVIAAGGSGYKSIEVVRGKANVYAHVTKIKKWDICAGNAILHAVGGHMKTLTDEMIDYDNDSPAANEDGLLASVNNFEFFMHKLAPEFAKER